MSDIRVPVRIAQDDPDRPSRFLVADKADLDEGNRNGMAYIEDAVGRKSPAQPLQRFYKFAIWYDYTGAEP